MDLIEELLKEHSKRQATFIANHVLKENRFDELMQIFFNSDYRLNQRSAYVMNICYDIKPGIIKPYLTKLIDNLQRTDIHVAAKRNTVRILQFIDIDDDNLGKATDMCFKFLKSNKETIAVKAFAMKVLVNACKIYPELKNELIPIIEDMLPNASPGIKNRGKKFLKELK